MDKEKTLKIATSKLESTKTHRIDLLRAMSGMGRNAFDMAIMELAQAQKLELVGGDTSGMTDRQIEDRAPDHYHDLVKTVGNYEHITVEIISGHPVSSLC